jgi:N-acetylmuramoyl-L-alanine amidase
LVLHPLPISAQAIGELTVNPTTLNVRAGAGLEHKVIGQISQGEAYQILKEKNNWYQIKLKNNENGWVASWLVEFSSASGSTRLVEAKVNGLNVRSGPSTSFQTITQIHSEQTFPFIKAEGDWVQIKLNKDEKGWVASWLVTIEKGQQEQATKVHEKATVQATVLNVRSGPDTSFNTIGKLYKGEGIDILEVKDGWYKIGLKQNFGWVAGDYIDQSVADESKTIDETSKGKKKQVQVATSTLNVRSSSALDSDVMDQLSKGALVDVIGEDGDWLEISHNGKKGWIAKWLVTDVTLQVTNQPKVTILNDGTNLRNGPATSFGIVTRANQGDSFNVVATEGDWFQVLLEDGSKAYIAGWIVSTEGLPSVERQGLTKYLKGRKIVIDSGHGGKDSGASGSHFNTLEKIVNLEVSNLLKSKFEAAGAQVVMTRTSNRFLTLQQRVDVSILEKADVFLSIHHNTNDNPKINGTITYFFSNGEDRKLANVVQQELVKSNGLKDLKARKGNFFVLRENPQLSILIELGFLTNYNDELTIRTNKFKENSSTGILHGVAKYFKDKEE